MGNKHFTLRWRVRIVAALLCVVMVFTLSGCGGQGTSVSVPDTPTSHGVVAKSKILTADQLAAMDGESEESEEEEEPPEETEQPEETETETETPETASPDLSGGMSVVAPDVTGESGGSGETSGTYTTYRYQTFVLDKAKESNAVFSGESFLTSLDMWREMIGGTEQETLKKYISRDYIGFDSTDCMKQIKRIWIDDSLSPINGSENRLSDLFYSIDMGDPSATTAKNSWVAEQTGGYITYTPSNLSEKSVMDLMSVLSFSDGWSGGTKPYDAKNRIFYNADGTESKTVMFRDEGLTYWQLDNAKAYCMYFNDGSYAMIILPDKDVDMADVDVAALMAGQIASKKAHVSFYMPEFSTESTYVLSPSDFSLPVGTVSSSVISGVPSGFTPSFSQVAKIAITHAGAGQAAGGTPISLPSGYDDDLDVVSIVCNRPFMYYIGDAENEDVALFGVVNKLTDDMLVSEEEAAAAMAVPAAE